MSTPPPPPGGDDNPYNYDPQSASGSGEGQSGDQGYGDSNQPGYGQSGDQGYGDSNQQGYGQSGQQYDQGTPGYSGGYQSAPSYSGGQPPNTVDNNFGVIALVTGLVGLLLCQPVGIAAIIYGRKAQAAERSGRADNGTLGVVGFWLGVVALVLMVIGLIFLVLLFAGVVASGAAGFSTY